MRLEMVGLIRTALVGLILSLSIAGAMAEEDAAIDPPLECPHCGKWRINKSEPFGALGETLTVESDFISFPSCGLFKIDSTQQSSQFDEGGSRTYRTELTLQPLRSGPLCDLPKTGEYRLEAVVSVGYQNDGGVGQFVFYGQDANVAVLTASGSNYERENPCETGAGAGVAECLLSSNAMLYRTLAQAAYLSILLLDDHQNAYSAVRFNPASFAAEVMHFCMGSEAENGGGHWPYFWGLSCQAVRMEEKIREFRAWRSCVAGNNATCAFPDEEFDRSKDDEE